MGQKSAMVMPNRAHNPQTFEQHGILPMNIGVFHPPSYGGLDTWHLCHLEAYPHRVPN
jgi:hypothetical protein